MTKSSTHKILSDEHRKTAPKVAARKARLTNGKTAPEVTVAKAGDTASKVAPQVAAEKASNAQFEVRVPSSMHALAERNVAQTRELYERSKNTLHAVLESLEQSCEGAVALNRKIIDIAERNVSTGFDLAMSLAGARNLAEVMNLQADYWRKQFDNLSAQTEELRALSTRVATSVTKPIKAQVTHGIDA
jgi:phasin